jgi:hypothetical protein
MAKALLNVRLDSQDAQLVKQLRARGISISTVVRRALREEADKLAAEPVDAKAVFAEIFQRYPTPPQLDPLDRPDTTDRRAVAEYIANKLKARP